MFFLIWGFESKLRIFDTPSYLSFTKLAEFPIRSQMGQRTFVSENYETANPLGTA
jgi:hypothetical protein